MTMSGQGTHGEREARERYSWAVRRLPLVSLGANAPPDAADAGVVVDGSPGRKRCPSLVVVGVFPPRRRRLRSDGSSVALLIAVDEDRAMELIIL